MSGSSEEKKAFYSRPDIVGDYDDWRFNSAGGRYVDEIERSLVCQPLKPLNLESTILDMPVGTGRVSHTLLDMGFSQIHGADFSPSMLQASEARCGKRLQLSHRDAFQTGFEDNLFDVVISLRFTFHHENSEALLTELGRLVRPGGRLIFDTLNWTPRSHLAFLWSSVGGTLWCHDSKQVRKHLIKAGFTTITQERVFLLPSFAYRYVPGFLLPVVRFLESSLPQGLRSKSFWTAYKPEID